MKIKNLLASAALALASIGLSASASAAVLTPTLTSSDGQNYSGTFGNTVQTRGEFWDTFNFLPTTLGGEADGFIGTIKFLFLNVFDIDFISVTLNNQNFFLVPEFLGVETGFLLPVHAAAPLQLVVHGTSGGNGSYSGTLNVRADVPEPGMLALLGIAGLGLALSRRRKGSKVLENPAAV